MISFSFFIRTKLLENYIAMTALTFVSALVGLLLYPFVIRQVGTEAYGLYVFALTVSNYFDLLVNYGFDTPAVRRVVECKDDKQALSAILSAIFTGKLLLFALSLLVFIPLVLFVPLMRENWLLFSLPFIQIFGMMLFPIWYFQGRKNMKIVTIINLIFRLLMIPLVFLFISSPEDNVLYMLIVVGMVFLGGVVATFQIRVRDGISYGLANLSELKIYFKEGWSFFLSSITGVFKESTLTLFLGICFGMHEVALYDLAVKIVNIPRLFTQSINKALFPEVVDKASKSRVKKIFRYEALIGLLVMACVAVFGYFLVLFMGGKEMLMAYPMAVILSVTILTWLIVGAYIHFVFVPNNRYSFVAKNQFVAMISCLLIFGLIYGLTQSVFSVVIALSLSGIVEILYCIYLTKKI
ncbi:MAG: oligosaccharide flippase family protein [Paludibacteraceae bacterium]|nr:oligosaccharide flippase family protein [Paludibacteraceae bacterium]